MNMFTQFFKNLFHQHYWTYKDNPSPATKDRYPAIRICKCGEKDILRSAWSGIKERSDGTKIEVATPEMWFPLEKPTKKTNKN